MDSYTTTDHANNDEPKPPAYAMNRFSEDDQTASLIRPSAAAQYGEDVAPPPDYSALRASSLNFVIDGSFVSAAITSREARYQLTTNIDQDLREMRIRRLSPEESRRFGTGYTAMRFHKEDTLYTINRIPLAGGYIALYGQRKDALPGEIRVKHSLGRWKIWREYGKDKEEHEVLFRIWDIGHADGKPLVWKDGDGKAVAVESREREGDATSRPLLKLNEDMDELRKDALVACWVTRVWSFAGQPKTWKEKGEQVRHLVQLGQGFAPQPYTGWPKG